MERASPPARLVAAMIDQNVIPTLFLFTLIAAAVIAGVMLARFMRNKANRHPLDNERGHELEELRARQNAQRITDTPPTRRGH